MATFRPTPPQQFLDEMHDADVPALFDANMNARARADAIQSSKRKLARTKARLETERDNVRSRYMSSKEEDRIQKALAPYLVLYNLIQELEGQIADLEKRLSGGKLIPEGFHFGDRIFGNAERGEWFLGDRDDEMLWEEAEKLRKQLEEFLKQREPLATKQRAIKEKTARTKKRLEDDTRKLKYRGNIGYIAVRLLILLVVGGAIMGYGYFRFSGTRDLLTQTQNLVWPFIMGAGFALVLSIPFIYGLWRRNLGHLEDRIKVWQHDIEEFRHDSVIIQRDYIPLNDKCKQLKAQYDEIRAHFG